MDNFEEEYQKAISQLRGQGFYDMPEDELDTKTKEIGYGAAEAFRDEVINRIFNDIINKSGPGGMSGTSTGKPEGAEVSKQTIAAIQQSLVAQGVAAPVAMAAANTAAVNLGSAAAMTPLNPLATAAIIAASCAPIVGNTNATNAVNSLANEDFIQQSETMFVPTSPTVNFLLKAAENIITLPSKLKTTLGATAIGLIRKAIGNGKEANEMLSENFPHAKEIPQLLDARKKYRNARGLQLMKEKMADVEAITGGTGDEDDPENRNKKDWSKEDLEALAYQCLDEADQEFNYKFDKEFRKITTDRQGISHRPLTYDERLDMAIENMNELNDKWLKMSQEDARKLAEYKKSPEYAERLQKAADNFLKSSLDGRAMPEAKQRYADYKIKQGEKLIGKENLKTATDGRGFAPEKFAKDMERVQEWKDSLPTTNLPKPDTSDMDATSFKKVRDDFMKASQDYANLSSKDKKINTAADLIMQKNYE